MDQNIKLYVDNRETKCLSCFSKDTIYEIKQLDIGDFQIVNVEDDNKPIYVIERKTIQDLVSSLKDGRYSEQKIRACSLLGNVRFAYIIELNNSFSWKEENVADKQINSVIINTMIRDRINIFFSNDVNDSCTLVSNIFNRFNKNKEKYYFDTNIINTENHLNCISIQSKKQKNINNTKTVAELQLAIIPGISIANAKDILGEFNAESYTDLIYKIKNCENPDKILGNIKGIGKVKVKSIMKYIR